MRLTKKSITIYVGAFTLLWTKTHCHSVLVSKNVSSWGPDTKANNANAVPADTKGHLPVSRLLLVLGPDFTNTISKGGEEMVNEVVPQPSGSDNNSTFHKQEDVDFNTTKTEMKSNWKRDLDDQFESLSRQHRTFRDSESNSLDLHHRVKRQYGGGGGGGGGGGYGGGGGGGYGGGGSGTGLYPILDQSLTILGYAAFFSVLVMAIMSLIGGRMGMTSRSGPMNDDPMSGTPPEILDDPDANCLQWIRCHNKKIPGNMGTPETEKMIYEVPMDAIPERYRDCPSTLKPCSPLTYLQMIQHVNKMRDKWKIV